MSIFQKRMLKNWKLASLLKTTFMFGLLVAPYFLILLTSLDPWIKLCLAVVMGIGMAGVGMNVMHDGNHGSFSRYDWVNKLMGASIYILLVMFTIGRFNTIFYIIPIPIFKGMMKIWKLVVLFAFRNTVTGLVFIDFNIIMLYSFMDCLPSIG